MVTPARNDERSSQQRVSVGELESGNSVSESCNLANSVLESWIWPRLPILAERGGGVETTQAYYDSLNMHTCSLTRLTTTDNITHFY